MSNSNDQPFKPEVHIEMWRHYDNLRQTKNNGFMAANSILAAIAGLSKDPKPLVLIIIVSILGITVCIAWFLLLKRNVAYIDYHREKAGGGDKNFWRPDKNSTIRSRHLDNTPVVIFILFWIGILIFLR